MAVVAANEAEQRAVPITAANVDPRLLMAARCGDSKRLKELLLLNDNGVEAAAQVVVVIDDDPRPPPAAPAAAAAPPPPPPPSGLGQLLDDAGVTIEGDSLLHVVAASGDGQEFLDCAKMIYDENKGLLVAQNNKGDTPLHCAAAAGNAKMISRLVARVAGDETAVKAFLRRQNHGGETALHQAVRAANKAAIDQLLSVDPELCSIPFAPAASPLYLAISLGDMDIARHLFEASKGKLSYSGPDGRNVLHAAVSRRQALPMLLGWLKDPKTVDIKPVDDADLLSQLTSQRDKQNGSTPLHLAASLEGWPNASLYSELSPPVWPQHKSATTLLLDANTSAAYLPDSEGLYPIHVAALADSLGVVKILLRRCPDCATLRDGKGRTFLHVAAGNKSITVARYVCDYYRTAKFSSILNVQDNDGNTALHRAVDVGNLDVVNCLIRNRQVHLSVPNKEAMTPLDLSYSKLPPRLTYIYMSPTYLIQKSLVLAGALHGGGRSETFKEKHMPKLDQDKESENLTNSAQVMGIVSVLVATVTFASAFTLPGGYRSADDGSSSNSNKRLVAGTPILAGSYAFDAFILADTLAFICSCLATLSLVYIGLSSVDLSFRCKYYVISFFLLQSSARNLVVAFALGLYLVLAPVAHNTAIAVCVIIFASLLLGNNYFWRTIRVVYVVRARSGTRMPAWRLGLCAAPTILLTPFWSFIIIFGLPAIWKVHTT